MFDVIEAEKSLLLIDPSPQVANLLSNLFGVNHVCDKADSVESSLAFLRRKEYSVVLCNADFAANKDLEMLRRVKAASPNSAGRRRKSNAPARNARTAVSVEFSSPSKIKIEFGEAALTKSKQLSNAHLSITS